MSASTIETNLNVIAAVAFQREKENEAFIAFLQQYENDQIDPVVHRLNQTVSAHIDCTKCGNCCKTLIINVEENELQQLSDYFNTTVSSVKEKYLEESQQGKMVVNTIPCHFLQDNSCTIYPHRFSECRSFPHLHKPGFIRRLSGTLMHYGRCPIIFSVIEALKNELGFQSP